MKPLHSVVEQQIDNYISEEVTITDAYQFSQYKTIQQIENFVHSKFTSGRMTVVEIPNPFFNTTKGKVNIAYPCDGHRPQRYFYEGQRLG
jgi:hypothetical protein